MSHDAYRQAGVDISAGQRATDLMKEAVQATYTPHVLAGMGAFGGLFSIQHLKNLESPILVASTDGVGTKTMVASKMGRWDTIGQDLVNHCVNDILVQGARPLFFMDYVASSRLEPEQVAEVVWGCAMACQQVGCALLGGETAEMPGVYQSGEIDLVGTIIGVVDRSQLIDDRTIQPGDVICALPSTGLHTNGYSLARKVLADFDWFVTRDDLYGQSIGDALLAIHRCYHNEVHALLDVSIQISGLAHITGGGVVDNLPRILPDGVGARIVRGNWQMPPIFKLIQRAGSIVDEDMFHAFNMGLGMLVVLNCDSVKDARSILPELTPVGEIVVGNKEVTIVS